MLHIHPNLCIPSTELRFTFVRSGGPGGQNVNKVASKAVLRWQLDDSPSLPEAIKARLRALQGNRITATGELVLTSQRFRDQGKNRRDCLEKVRAMIVEATRQPRPRQETRPTRAAIERRLAGKQRRAALKASRRALLSE